MKRRKVATKAGSVPCDFDYALHGLFEQAFGMAGSADGMEEERILEQTRKAEDDVYKDDFSSDDDDDLSGRTKKSNCLA